MAGAACDRSGKDKEKNSRNTSNTFIYVKKKTYGLRLSK